MSSSGKYSYSSFPSRVTVYGVSLSDMNMIDETFWQKNKTITFDQFYYAGKDMTFVNNDIHLVGKLNLLVKRIKNNINNTHYHEIAERIITNYRINDISYEHAYNNLNTILKE